MAATAHHTNFTGAKWATSFARLNRGQPGVNGLISFSEAWTYATEFLRPRDSSEWAQRNTFDLRKVKEAINLLAECKMLNSLLDDFVEEVGRQQHLISREIDQYMERYENTQDPQYIGQLVMRLRDWYEAWTPHHELGTKVLSTYKLQFQTMIFSSLSTSFMHGFKDLLHLTFSLVSISPSDAPSTSQPVPPKRVDVPLWRAFDKLGFLERYESLISGVCYEYIEKHILETCTRKWDEPMLSQTRQWMADRIVPWLLMPYARGATSAEEARVMLQGIGTRLDFHVCKTLCELRTQELFDIIIDYPDSTPALQDLKECLQRVDQRGQLVQALRKANKKRLLHPGADTRDILTQYVSIIRCLRIIDPPGVLLYKVADPIRHYLRERPDTIRCIVASLVGDAESGESLVDDNEPIQPLQQQQEEDYSDPKWEPDPIDAGPEFRTNKPSDIISTLVSIYDSKELFVKELQVLLAQRLLAIKDGKYEKERRNIEILKIRFGESALQVCEVMLKDMTDSRRTDQHIQAQKSSALHATIISKHFWPPLQSSKFEMPGQLKQIRDEYAKEYHLFKPDKKLIWLPHLGTLKLDIELDDRTISAEVAPLDAAFIELFSQKETWTVAELIGQVGKIDRMAALKALGTWVDLGVLKETEPDTFNLLNVAEAGGPSSKTAARPAMVVDEPPPVTAVEQQQAEQMRVFWKFIEGMLRNLGTLPLDRIQNMLKFAPGYDRTIEQLAAFMEAARREGLVTVKDGMWRLQR
ncbi:hypothetical protein K474DRAFT_1602300 [Panus rudis PR-1116 ss-1]|nr:hypothetical protein K474DRAFT_1602300 [Panus rudis PR-1116 ss-1]